MLFRETRRSGQRPWSGLGCDSYRWFSVRARPYRGTNGAVARWFGTLTDIHDRQTAVEANTHMVDAMMKGYLSKKFPTVRGLEFDTLYRAANVMEKIGGDWYDVFELPDGRIGFSLGDVCGHGVDAAVKMELHMPPRIRTHEFAYESGSMMVLYTDGLIEFDHDLLDGEDRLLVAAA